MERLTFRYDGVPIFEAGRESNIIARLCDIEEILGDDYDLARLRELVTADKEGRCVVLPKNNMLYFHEESIDGSEKWVGNWPIKDVLLKCGFGIASLTYSIRDVGSKIYFDYEAAEAALAEKGAGNAQDV